MCCCRPPQDVYSANVANKLSAPITVAITFKNPDKPDETESINIAPGATHFFAQRTFAKGSANFTFVIKEVKVTVGAHTINKAAPFAGVSSPTKDFWFAVTNDAAPTITESKTAL